MSKTVLGGFPFIKQTGKNNCWAACIEMVLSHKGASSPQGWKQKDLTIKYGDLPMPGNKINHILHSWVDTTYFDAVKHPVSSYFNQNTFIDEISGSIDVDNPIILITSTGGAGYHTVVITGYDSNNKQCCIFDPGNNVTWKDISSLFNTIVEEIRVEDKI